MNMRKAKTGKEENAPRLDVYGLHIHRKTRPVSSTPLCNASWYDAPSRFFVRQISWACIEGMVYLLTKR
ncbi:uncharacterized protein STEHIDRAFT_126552 [Stereum hirsutum FP-91666 SS1]|uniref:Uncharacterized protein n=1 Tax=Stereum hirsutum (strain FP-91666) TaxID=721885 RepID=R7RWY4_STEHR|nr:uncharacterized protein STEHIDRAFT_126552 [Stereum hirsutum FP-91666 SS1]EIM79323.1 hypothetical protein STEHIDRAFT_126552 [Stereum hirsutum FP-91666 SS1]